MKSFTDALCSRKEREVGENAGYQIMRKRLCYLATYSLVGVCVSKGRPASIFMNPFLVLEMEVKLFPTESLVRRHISDNNIFRDIVNKL
jgi:hypothetical protein